MQPSSAVVSPDAPAFYETYRARIHRYILSMVQDPQEAEDLTQETFLCAYAKSESLRHARAGLTWLYRIATHISLDRLRQHGRRAVLLSEQDVEEIDPADPDAPSLSHTVEQGEMSSCVQQYLSALPDPYRTVIMLQDMHGLTGPEIASLLGLPLSTVKIRLHRARRKLHEALQAGCSFSHDERNVLVCEPKP